MRSHFARCFLLSVGLFTAQAALAQQSTSSAMLRFTLLDAPYNLRHGYKSMSMSESLNLGRSWHSALHIGLERWLEPADSGFNFWKNQIASFAIDSVTGAFPLGTGWTHEEWHMAVMTHRGISSHNTINDLRLFDKNGKAKDVFYVDGQTDEDHIRLKKYHPKDQLRLAVAGNESEREFTLSLLKDRFYAGQSTIDWPILALTTYGSYGYVSGVANGDLDKQIPDLEKEEGADPRKRDFIGPDFSGWVRDLYRPAEPFEARGVHPSGVGIRRYTKTTDLTSDEKAYLKKQANLHLLNFVMPQMFGFDSFSMTSPTTGRELGWNASLAHYMTPFGYALRMNVFLKTQQQETPFGTHGLFFAWQQNVNKEKSYPQIEVEHRPIPIGDGDIGVGARAMLWLQPKDLDFFALKPEVGGLLGTKVVYNSSWLVQPWVEVEGKTKGWIAGEVELGQTYGLRAGVQANLK